MMEVKGKATRTLEDMRRAALRVAQGELIGRPARLRLDVDQRGSIFVGGRVIELARGTLSL